MHDRVFAGFCLGLKSYVSRLCSRVLELPFLSFPKPRLQVSVAALEARTDSDLSLQVLRPAAR